MSRRLRAFWRNSRDWSLAWQLVVAVLVILVGVLAAAAISDALYGSASSKSASQSTKVTTNTPTASNTAAPSTTRVVRSTTTTTHTPTTVAARPTAPSTSAPSSSLVPLTIAPFSHRDSYNRDADFGGWIDVDGCKDTRAEVLIRTSQAPVTFTRPSQCTVKTGRWTDPWSGVTTTVAHDFQIDHTVPLANAWRSGAWAWTHAQRVAYANDLTDTDHLVPILASENESKGDSGPDQWKPPNHGAWCRYALDWDHIAAKWHLNVTPAEWNAIVAMAANC